MSVFRVNKNKNYIIVPNEVLLTRDLSIGAKGLYCEILSYLDEPDFELTKEFFYKKGPEDIIEFTNMWDELEHKGYLSDFVECEGE